MIIKIATEGFRTARFAAGLLLAAVMATSLAGCASAPAAPATKSAGKYAFWPLAPDEPRIQFVGAFNSSEDVSATKASDFEKIVFGKDAVLAAYVNKPYGIAVRDGKIYVCDIRSKALVVMDLAKKQTRLVGTTGASKLERPIAVAIGDDGQIYVADGIHGAIVVFDKGERFSRSMTIPKFKPAGMALSGDRLFVTDMGRQQVLIIDRNTGKELGVIGSVGDDDGQFRLPVGITIDKAGNVYVADMMRCKVQKFTPDGQFLSAVGQAGDHAGGFARPKHLAVDSDGIVYVVDAGFQNVQMFDSEFRLLMHFGAAGDFPGAMNLPVGIAVTDTGLEYFQSRVHPGFEVKRIVVVANQFGDGKISVYAMGERRATVALAELTASAASVSTGVAEPSPEMLKFQNVGGIEPGGESTPEESLLEPSPTPAPPAPAKASDPKPPASAASPK